MTIRMRGLMQCLAGGAVFAMALWWFMDRQQTNPRGSLPGGPFGLIVLAAPGGLMFAGLLQAITGLPFSGMSEKWNALAGWQRGVIGTMVFVGGLCVLFGGLALYGFLTAS